MSEEDLLKVIREGIEGSVKAGNLTQDAVMMWLFLKMYDKLCAINDSLEVLMKNSDDEWNARHNT